MVKQSESTPKPDGHDTTAGNQGVFAIVAQYARDLSVECPTPAHTLGEANYRVAMDVGVGSRALEAANRYEVVLKLTGRAEIDGGGTGFLVEIEYIGEFHVENIADDQRDMLLSVEGAALLFPFARQMFTDAIAHTGYRPGTVQPINFHALYHQAKQQQASAQQLADSPVAGEA